MAVDGIDLTVPRGALYGVIGPNGAGKTTCIRMIMSILFPDSGELSVLGPALRARGQGSHRLPAGGARRLPQDEGRRLPHLHGAAEGDEPRRRPAARVPQLLESIGLPGTEDKRCEDLSKGMLQRVQFIAAVIHQPDLLILDEPFSGQDPVSVRLLREHIVQRAPARRHGAALDARHGQRRGDVPARGDDSPGTQGARRSRWPGCGASSIPGRFISSRSIRGADVVAAPRGAGVERVERDGRRLHGDARRRAPTQLGAWRGWLPRCRRRASSSRVFGSRTCSSASSSGGRPAARRLARLRASLQAPGAEGAFA